MNSKEEDRAQAVGKGLRMSLVDRATRQYTQLLFVLALLAVVALLMSCVNFITQRYELGLVTTVFAVASLINGVLLYRAKRVTGGVYLLFSVSVLALCSYLIITGGADGISPIWICLLPTCAPLLLGMKRGLVLCGVMLAQVILLLDTPLGLQFVEYPYRLQYRMRFPIVFIGLLAVGLLNEGMVSLTYRQLDEQWRAAKMLSQMDVLTGLHNRAWYNEQLKNQNSQPEYRRRYVLMLMDIDHFKEINDTYGHLFGDEVLTRTADAISQVACKDGLVCRWGGDEFLCQMRAASEEEALSYGEAVRRNVERIPFHTPDGGALTVTLSIGGVFVPNPQQVYSNELFGRADQVLYQAKDGGRNCVLMQTLHKESTEDAETAKNP